MQVKRASESMINSNRNDSELKQVKANSNPSLGISYVGDSFQDSSTNTMVAGESPSYQDHLRYRQQISRGENENNLRQPPDDQRTRNNGNNLKQPGTERDENGNNLQQPPVHQEESKLKEHFIGLAGPCHRKKERSRPNTE